MALYSGESTQLLGGCTVVESDSKEYTLVVDDRPAPVSFWGILMILKCKKMQGITCPRASNVHTDC